MRSHGNLFEQVYPFDSLHAAYLRARRGKRDKREVLQFERDLEGQLIQLQNELIWGTYRTGPYRAFYVSEPKRRLVAALPFRDRVVQHSLVGVLEPIWERRFIAHSYACRPGRGMHAAADQAQKWLRDCQRQHGSVYVLKADIAGYFANIDHGVLMQLLRRHVRCEPTLRLCRDIMSTWAEGLPIGNLTSQLWANIYLDALDRHVKHDLREPMYCRYMDDWLIVHHDKARLHELRHHLDAWLRDKLHLRLNRKTQVFRVSKQYGRGLDFVGYRMWPERRLLRKVSVRRFRRRLAALRRQYRDGRIDIHHVQPVISAWLGHAGRANTTALRTKLLSQPFRRAEA